MAKSITKHKSKSIATLPRSKTDAKRQAHLVGPWLALANAAEDPSADLLALTRECLDAEEIARLQALPREQVIEKIRNLTDIVCELFRVLLDVAEEESLEHRPSAREGIEIPAEPSFDIIHFAIGADGHITARRISLDRFFFEILPELVPENVRICTRERCQRLFYAARKDQYCCTPRCAQLVRQGAYNQRRKEKG